MRYCRPHTDRNRGYPAYVPATIHAARRCALPMLAAILLGACRTTTPLPTDAMARFSDAVAKLEVSADSAMATEQRRAFQHFLDRQAERRSAMPIKLEKPAVSGHPRNDYFTLIYPAGPALHRDIEQARQQLAELNTLLSRHADALLQLAAADPDARDFNRKDFTRGLSREAQALNQTSGLGLRPEEIEALSFATGKLLAVYLQSRRREALSMLIRQASPVVNKVTEHAMTLMQLSAVGLAADYQREYAELARDYGHLNDKARRHRSHRILKLNQRITDQLEILWRLRQTYQALSATHAAMADHLTADTPLPVDRLSRHIRYLEQAGSDHSAP